MSDAKSGGFPRRDDDGRIRYLGDLVGTVLGGLVIGLLVMVVLDWAVVLLGSGSFGGANGWLSLILPAWLFVEEFRSWDPGPVRIVVALVAAAVGLTLGLAVAGWLSTLPTLVPALWTGTAGAAVAALAYSLIWFVGIRWLDRRAG